MPEIHGLTTATSVWLSAAVGILCGGGRYVLSFFSTALGVVFLRFVPSSNELAAEEDISTNGETDGRGGMMLDIEALTFQPGCRHGHLRPLVEMTSSPSPSPQSSVRASSGSSAHPSRSHSPLPPRRPSIIS